MKTLVSLLLIIAFLYSCNTPGKKDANTNGYPRDTIYNDTSILVTKITKDVFDHYDSADPYKDLVRTKLVKVVHDTLKLSIGNGASVIFTDTLTNTDNSEIRINHHFGNVLDYYAVQASFYESSTFYLVNRVNGNKYEMVSEPLLSPGRKYIYANCGSLGYDEMPTEFQVWKIGKDKLTKKADVDLGSKGIEIERIKMISDDTLAVRLMDGDGRCSYGVVVIK